MYSDHPFVRPAFKISTGANNLEYPVGVSRENIRHSIKVWSEERAAAATGAPVTSTTFSTQFSGPPPTGELPSDWEQSVPLTFDEAIWPALPFMLLPPAVVLVFGLLMVWIVRGFRLVS
jgi:hypothetical protein